ncbi:T9SS type B sorting domain-containing protein [Empedobacter brevis]|uniref:T9SS type B sorting domain-containing protein n=1 Tax=Empedobacter brevis TaxID=247 RepID=UPI00333FC408
MKPFYTFVLVHLLFLTSICYSQTIWYVSPNGDGKNDLLDFSFLSTKENPKLLIVDRFGKAVFKDYGESNFIWNGKHPIGSALPSTTYWYRLEWKEANAENTTSLQGAILLKSK